MAAAATPHLGYTTQDERSQPYASFFDPKLDALPSGAAEAVLRGPRPFQLFESPKTAHLLQDEGYLPIETGYGVTPSGGMVVACLHDMPGVTPAMWDWWFSWHGSESARYKLWHPQAHIEAAWADGEGFTGSYIGRTSNVIEYIGDQLIKVGISFMPPREAGLDEEVLRKQGAVAICARGGVSGFLAYVQFGTFMHYVRPTERGCEMRSRFWLGGDNARCLGDNFVVRFIASTFARRRQQDAVAMLVHNAEEMAHLARFLPKLYAEFGPDQAT